MWTLSSITTGYIRKLQEKVPQEHAKAQQALKAGNKSEAQLCLTRRKLMENEVKYGVWHFKTKFPFFAPIEFFGRQSVFTNPRPPWKRLASPLSAHLCNHWSLGDLGPRGTKHGCLCLDVNLQRYTRPQSLRQLLINWSTEESQFCFFLFCLLSVKRYSIPQFFFSMRVLNFADFKPEETTWHPLGIHRCTYISASQPSK